MNEQEANADGWLWLVRPTAGMYLNVNENDGRVALGVTQAWGVGKFNGNVADLASRLDQLPPELLKAFNAWAKRFGKAHPDRLNDFINLTPAAPRPPPHMRAA